MIPNHVPYEAVFRHCETRDDGVYESYSVRPVIAWDAEGRPLVAGARNLVGADTYSNFVGIEPAGSRGDWGDLPRKVADNPTKTPQESR